MTFKGCMQPNQCFCKLQDVPQALEDVCKRSQDGSGTLQNAAKTVSNAHKMPSKGVIEVRSFEAWLLKDVCSQITVFASSKTYLRCFKTSLSWFQMAQRRFKPLQIWFRMHLGRFQRRHRSVQVRSLIFKGFPPKN